MAALGAILAVASPLAGIAADIAPSVAIADPLRTIDFVPRRPGPAFFGAAGNAAFFSLRSSHGEELWMADASGARLVRDVAPGPADSAPAALGAPPGNPGLLVFLADPVGGIDDGTNGTGRADLWVSDGTPAGTRIVLEQAPTFRNPTSVGNTATLGDRIYLAVREPGGLQSLAATDGTPGGTGIVQSFSGDPDPGTVILLRGGPDRLWLVLRRIVSGRWELWASDGTVGGAVSVADLGAGPVGLLGVDPLNRAFLQLRDDEHGAEPWIADLSGVSMLADLEPGPDSSFPSAPHVLPDGQVIFSTNGPTTFGHV